MNRTPPSRSGAQGTRQQARPTFVPKSSLDPIKIFRQNLFTLFITGFIGGILSVATFVVLDRYAPKYSSEVMFELQPRLRGATEIMTGDLGNDSAVERECQTEVAKILARTTLERAMRSRDVEATNWSDWYKGDDGVFLLDEAVDELQETLGGGHRRKTQIFSISWSAAAPRDVPVILNRIADTYMDIRRDEEKARFAQNLSIFTRQREEIENDLTFLSTQIATHIKDKDITSLQENLNQDYEAIKNLTLRINETKSALTLAQSQRMQTEAKLLGTLEPSSEDIRNAELDPIIRGLISRERQIRTELTAAQDRYGPGHREVTRIKSLLNATEDEVKAATDEALDRNLTADFKEVTNQIDSFTQVLQGLESEYTTKEARLKELAADMSALDAMQARQQRLEEERNEIQSLINELSLVQVREDSNRVAIIQRALTPRNKSFPDIKIVIPGITLLLVGLVFGLLILREFLDKRVKTPSDLANITDARLLGVIPDIEDDSELDPNTCNLSNIINDAPLSVISESYRRIADEVKAMMEQDGFRSLLVLGGLPQSGTTSVAANLAELLSNRGMRVLLVDLNLRRPSLADAFQFDAEAPGLADVLAGQGAVDDVIIKTDRNIDVLAAGTPGNRDFHLLSTPEARQLRDSLREKYDLVVYDAPPAIAAAESMMIAGQVEATLLVIRAKGEQQGLVGRLASQLSDKDSHFLGIVLNRPRNAAGGYFKANYKTVANYSASDSPEASDGDKDPEV